ncbi:MAG: hypothetical protein NUW37_16655, partial [Planctomycetes bacterium]|nr:hypothetical protein [Planctomycetota bacterium]
MATSTRKPTQFILPDRHTPGTRRLHPVRRVIPSLLLIFFLSMAVNWRSVTCDFVNFDDDWLILTNPHIRSLTPENIITIFNPFCDPKIRSDLGGEYLPIRDLSYAIDYALFGLNSSWFHFVNILIHSFSAVLVYLVGRMLLRCNIFATVSALIFALHPSHVESVAWVTGRKDVLCVFFTLLSFYFYARSRFSLKGKRKRLRYALSIVLFVFAMMSKSYAVVLPAILLMFDVFFGMPTEGRKKVLKRLYYPLPHIVIAGIFTMIAIPIADRGLLRGWYGDPPSWWTTAGMMGKVFLEYIGLMFLPAKLEACVDYPYDVSFGLFSILGWIVVLFLGGYCALYLFVRISKEQAFYQRADVMVFGILWFLVSLVPVCQLIVPHGTVYAERFLYLSSVGFSLSVALIFERMIASYRRLGSREQGAGSREQGTGSREQGAESREQGAGGSREQRAGNREQRAGSREQGA